MDTQLVRSFLLFSEAFRYPEPGALTRLEKETNSMREGSEKRSMLQFLSRIRPLSLGEWEELHTRTLDLNPPAAPYIGFQVWGESYQRGEFLSKMNRALFETKIDTDGELPDHLVPVLRYLAQTDNPLPELADIMNQAVQRMNTTLRQVEPANPYIALFEGVLNLSKIALKEAV